MPLARISSRTSLQYESLPQYKTDTVAVSPTSWTGILAGKTIRRLRQRASLLAILFLAILSTIVFVIHHPALVSSFAAGQTDSTASKQISLALDNMLNSRLAAEALEKYQKATEGHHQLSFTPRQELAAVTGFLTSLPHNVIPSFVDPSSSIDPQLVLDFDTRTAHGSEAVEEMVSDVWANNPVMLWSKYYSASSREIKKYLTSLHLQPPPTIIDVDMRDDSEVLTPLLYRLTSSAELPILLIGGKPIGTTEVFREKAASGELQQQIREAGAIINGGGKRRGGRK
ncbi:hypothetical protein VNI00_008568 [Paramarasmius palmivorus]|uniref:Uncharacterized protein n=1 Tax=Paramarasmius palmivorus TaxID=297713 RepID=A0AAW0CY72_9AGAR